MLQCQRYDLWLATSDELADGNENYWLDGISTALIEAKMNEASF